MNPPHVLVQDAALARALRAERLLMASLRHEPTFKFEEGVDDPDEAMALLEEKTPKKARRVKGFDFDMLLPLRMTMDEAVLASDLGRVAFERASLRGGPTSNAWRVVAPTLSGGASEEPPTAPPDFVQAYRRLHPARVATFRVLWETGHSMVDGLKFGADFLAYAGDPTRTHADLMVTVVPDHNRTPAVECLDATALSTLAAKTRKSIVLASLDPATNQVSFTRVTRIPVNLATRSGVRLLTKEDALLEEIPVLGAAPVLDPDAPPTPEPPTSTSTSASTSTSTSTSAAAAEAAQPAKVHDDSDDDPAR